MQCTLTVYRFEQCPVAEKFVFDVQDSVHRVKQMLLERYGVPGLTVKEVFLEVHQQEHFSKRDPGPLPLLGDDRPIADLWWDVWINSPFYTFQIPSLKTFCKCSVLRRLHRENAAGEREFVVYVRITVPSPDFTPYRHSIQCVTGSMSVRSLKDSICSAVRLTHLLDRDDYSVPVLYDFRDCRVFEDTRTLEESGITPGSVLGLDISSRYRMEDPAEAFPVTVVREGTEEDVTVYVRPTERLSFVEERLWLLGHITSSTKWPSDRSTGQQLGFFSPTAYERRDTISTVRQLNIQAGTRLQLQWKHRQDTGPLIASITLESDILSPSVLGTKSAGKDPVSVPSQPSSADKAPVSVPSQPSSGYSIPLEQLLLHFEPDDDPCDVEEDEVPQQENQHEDFYSSK